MRRDSLIPKYLTSINQINGLSFDEKEALQPVADQFPFRANEYYVSLIDWNDQNDPIRKLIIPSQHELYGYGKWDACDEETNYVVPGCQHKYSSTALLVISDVCGGYCRYCFRKRLFVKEVREAKTDITAGLNYIRSHKEIDNVLLTGGDSLMLSTRKLKEIIQQLREIDHVKIIRLGSKLPAYNPMRIYEDKDLLALIRTYSNPEKRIYIMSHISHPREITNETKKCFQALIQAGAILMNQTPVLKGINDAPDVLAELMNQLSWIGVTPYYFFINRPVAGNYDFVLPLKEAYTIVEQAKAKTSGLGKRVRLVMSHSSGKIEIMAIENGKAYLKYHQSRDGEYGKLMILDCPDDATWFDDLPGNEVHWKNQRAEQVLQRSN
jgi:lysine 2,3-aminomutase